MSETVSRPVIWFGMDMIYPENLPFFAGELFGGTVKSPSKPKGGNEDAAAIVSLSMTSGVLAVADGVGSSPDGARASRILVSSIVESDETKPAKRVCEAALRAHSALINEGHGNSTTLVAVAVDGTKAKTLHAGDSSSMVIRRTGEIVHRTISHSPVAKAEVEGRIDARTAMFHPYRNVVSRVVGGYYELEIEESEPIPLEDGDTVILASDGLFDNLMVTEVSEIMASASLKEAAQQLWTETGRRMTSPSLNQPSHPDDLTFLLLRV